MSTIETFFQDTALNTRKTTATPTSSDSVVTITTSISGLLSPITDKSKLFVENNIGKEFDYVAASGEDVLVGDDLYIDSTKYDVIGVATFEDLENDVDSYLNIRIVK